MTDWRRYCVGARGIQVDRDAAMVALGRGRKHRVDVAASQDVIELSAVVARRGVVEVQENPTLAAWKRNRSVSLVGFRLDDRGRLVGESWVPAAGLTDGEFVVYLRGLAAACDLFEFQLTGKDKE